MLWTRWLYLRALGVVYLAAFASLWVQVHGLMGEGGVVPASAVLARQRQALGDRVWLEAPSLFHWFGADDRALTIGCAAGVACALAVCAGRLQRAALAGAWALYLSFVTADAVFLRFQWDGLLLEAGLLSIALAPGGWRPGPGDREPPAVAVWLLRLLLFKLMFLSGVVKIASGDPAWRDLTALGYHWWTQPLPAWTAWFVDKLPRLAQQAMAALVFGIELALPCFMFGSVRLRAAAAAGTAALMLAIAATGSYGFFNLLTLALFLMLL